MARGKYGQRAARRREEAARQARAREEQERAAAAAEQRRLEAEWSDLTNELGQLRADLLAREEQDRARIEELARETDALAERARIEVQREKAIRTELRAWGKAFMRQMQRTLSFDARADRIPDDATFDARTLNIVMGINGKVRTPEMRRAQERITRKYLQEQGQLDE